MSAPASEDLRELERLLLVAREQGESIEFAQLREELQIGHDDLMTALSTLSEHGKAHEEAPGFWTGGADEDRGPVVVSVAAPADEPDGSEAAAVALDRLDRREAPALAEYATAGPTIRLTVAVANALDAESLGKLVKAGIDEAVAEHRDFTLEVV